MELARYPARHVRNPQARRAAPFGEAERAVLGLAAVEAARREISSWPGYVPTPLRPLPGLARRLGLGAVLYKDEGGRFGLGSFKALGGAYAVLRLLQRDLAERHGIEASASDLAAGRHRDLVRGTTVTTATDGNHGRSVAWGAERFGCRWGESGCAAAAGLIAAALDEDLRRLLDLGTASRVLVVGSEGATDAAVYRRTVGRTAEEVAGTP